MIFWMARQTGNRLRTSDEVNHKTQAFVSRLYPSCGISFKLAYLFSHEASSTTVVTSQSQFPVYDLASSPLSATKLGDAMARLSTRKVAVPLLPPPQHWTRETSCS